MKDIEEMAVKAITDILARSDKSFEASMQSVALEAFLRGREQGRQERDRQWEIRLGEFRKDLERHNLHGHYNLFQEHFAEPMAERYVAGAAYRELMAAAQAHVTALEACEPAINNAFGFSAIHGGNYTGPTYGKELTALKAALAALPAQDAELEQENAVLKARLERLSAPVSDEDWEAVRLQVSEEKRKVAPSPIFVRITGREVFNKIVAARVSSSSDVKGGNDAK